MKNILSLLLFAVLSFCYALPKQTDVHNAEHLFDEKGIAYLNIPDVGKTYNPAFVALYALNHAGIENYYNTSLPPDEQKFRNSVEWLCLNLKKMPNGLWAFPYDFDSTYNDITIKAPWYSAFGQAAGIDALVAGYQRFKDNRYLEAAKRAAETLLAPLDKGGLLFQKDGISFFEEIPSPATNPSHILNGNMRAMLAIYKLYTVTKEEKYLTAFRTAAESLKKLLPLYDTGYALRYDLNPKKQELLFRFNDPYNRKVPPIPIDLVKLVDPVSGKEAVIDFGGKSDAAGPNRIAGNDWQAAAELEGRTVRPLKAVVPVNPLHAADKGMNSPAAYFYFDLPFEWEDNLRTQPLELVVVYKDTTEGNCSVEMRSMAEGAAFRPLRDGDLFLTGSGEWREWRIPIRPSDLGFWCGSLYAEKHAQYLTELAKIDKTFSSWATVAKGYYHLESKSEYKNVVLPRQKLPTQTPGLREYSFSPKEKVIRQYFVINGKKIAQEHPFLVADQAVGFESKAIRPFLTKEQLDALQPEYAYQWLADKAIILDGGAAVWYFNFQNAYNDVLTLPPWTSSFSQIYVIKALKRAIDKKRTEPRLDYQKLYKAAIQAYRTPTEKGSFTAYTRFGVFFEELPNRTHVLNAHLSSMAELSKHPTAKDIVENGTKTLKETLHLFDAGYWMRYDQNPKKEFLLQIDWLEGRQSPQLASFSLQNPQTLHQIKVTLSSSSFNDWPGISGLEWERMRKVDGKDTFGFKNGYLIHDKIVKGGTRHNIYLKCSLPERESAEWFDTPEYILKLVYFDRAPGRFQLKTQSIREGNVLTFVPVRNGVLDCIGDGKWKEAYFHLRPQELGWFVGAAYQEYIVQQMESLGKEDWFFRQYALRHQYFLNFNKRKIQKPAEKPLTVSLLGSGNTYPKFGVANSLDGDPNNDYTAFYENAEQYFTLKLSKPVRDLAGGLDFESDANYASDWKVLALDEAGKEIASAVQKNAVGKKQNFEIHAEKKFTRLKFVFEKFAGQKRLLLRQFVLKPPEHLINQSGCVFRPFTASFANSINRVSIAEVDSDHLLFTNYQSLLLFNRKTGIQKTLVPDFSLLSGSDKKKKPIYVPTGVAIDCDGEVFLANYKGNNILRGKLQDGKIVFTRQYSSSQSIGPENVSVDKKRDVFVTANYDGGTITAFQISTGKQLWSTPVGQAHGVVIDQDFVYVTSLLTRDIQKLDLKTGKVILRRGGIGWDPAQNQYLWPTSVQNLDQDHLVVADAQNGFISKLRKVDLEVVDYFGGNGLGVDKFNYPYVAIMLSDGLYISSARRAGLLHLRLDPLRAETFWYNPKFWSRTDHAVSSLGRNWNNYRDLDPKHAIRFYGHTFGMGFGRIYDCKTNQEFMITNTNALYNPPNYLYFLQGNQAATDCSVFLSSSAPILYGIFELDPESPVLLLALSVGMDSWLTNDHTLVHASQHISLDEIVKLMRERAEILRKKMREQGRLTLVDLIRHAFISTPAYGGLTILPLSHGRTLDYCFVSGEGRRFLWRYNHDPNDLAAIRKAAAEYYRKVHGIPYLRLDEYLLVGMLSGVSPRTLTMETSGFFKVQPKQKLNSLYALTTSDLNDYTAADTISDSKFYFLPPSPNVKLKQLELIWYSPEEAGEEIRISGVIPNGRSTVLFTGKTGKNVLSEYAVSTVSLDPKQAYPKYLFEVLKGGKQKRLLLRAFTPDWKKKLSDPLLPFVREISLKKAYGVGGGVSSLSSSSILEQANTWHCGNFAVWFARHFPFQYKELKITDISAVTGAIHTVVEIIFNDGTIKVVDPTLGIVYDSDIQHMLVGAFNFEKGTHFSRAVSPIFNLHYGPQFFYQAKVKRIYSENEWKEK